MTNLEKDRFDNIKAMHTIICSMNDESAYMTWIMCVPDCPSDEDFEFIAEDEEEFEHASKLFMRLYRRYIKSGLFIGNKLYCEEEK